MNRQYYIMLVILVLGLYSNSYGRLSGGNQLGTSDVHFIDVQNTANNQPISDQTSISGRIHNDPPPHDIVILSVSDLPASQTINHTYNPTATITNIGSSSESFVASLSISSVYNSQVSVTDLPPGDEIIVNFSPWVTLADGAFVANISASLTGDATPENNEMIVSLSIFNDWVAGNANPQGAYLGSTASYTDISGTCHIITSGGISTESMSQFVQDYDIQTDTWSTLTYLPYGLWGHASVIVNNNLYIISGNQDCLENTVSKYDLATASWATMSPLPVAIYLHKAVSYAGNYIYVAGGMDDSAAYNSVYLYNIALDTWSTATPMPSNRVAGAFAITGNKLIYVAGLCDDNATDEVLIGTINSSDPSIIDWQVSGTRFPGGSNTEHSGGFVSVLEKLSSPDLSSTTRTESYPAGASVFMEGATWDANSILVTGGRPSLDWVPAVPCKAFSYDPYADLWTELPNLMVPVTGVYFCTAKNQGSTWFAVVSSGYDGSDIATNTQVISWNAHGIANPIAPLNVAIAVGSSPGTMSISWDDMNADWYGVYAGSTPLNLEYLGWQTNTNLTLPTRGKGFYKITSGTGFPIGLHLTYGR